MFLKIEASFGGHQVLASAIEGEALMVWMSTSPMLGKAHDCMATKHEVRVLELGGEGAQLELQALEGPLGPHLVPPDALVRQAVYYRQVLCL